MADVISFKDLAALSVSKMKQKELREFVAAQEKAMESLMKENRFLKEKLFSLEQMLQTQVIAQSMPLSEEEIICIDQISVLKSKSSSRELSLDEVKRLDLLIKNLRLIRQQSTQVIESKDYINMKESDLVAALNPPKSSED